jgi:hypothetical protein
MGKVAARDVQKESAWRRRLGQQARSGQSIRAWCRAQGVTETAFYWWRKELARRAGERKPTTRRDREDRAASFVPVHVNAEPAWDGDQRDRDQPGGGAAMEIVLTDGRRVRLTGPVNGEALAAVLDVLERRTC